MGTHLFGSPFNQFFYTFSASELFQMLDHTKTYVQKYTIKILNCQGINLTWKCRVCVWVAFLCLLCAFLPSLTTMEWIDQQHFAKTKMDTFLYSQIGMS